ncbi:MAG: ABC transporter substrate-binding protein, partial [Rhodobacterales bacterium]|nr:ABC transporter substrate-binding protein [Rhodobacterales bacterium]
MSKFFKKLSYSLTVALGISMISGAAIAKTELTMYYPVAVGGALTQTVDAMVADFMSKNPDIEVNAIYSGNYDDTRIKALTALESGKPAQ